MSKEKPTYNEIIFSKSQEETIINMYVKLKMSTVKIGKYFGCSHKKIASILDEYNIKRVGNGHRKYYLNENYFDNIDTPNKAYILGFLYADGNINPKKQTISMSLQEEDFEILEKIRNEIGSEKPLKFIDYSNKHDFGYTYKNQYRLLMFSKHMCESLIKLGMMPNKSLKLDFPEINAKLYRHFIRGYFDGDGSVYRKIVNKNNMPITLTITSTKSFCEKIKDIVEKEIGIYCGIYDPSNKNGITKVFVLSKNASIKFMDWIYYDADLYMSRKYDRYIEYTKTA